MIEPAASRASSMISPPILSANGMPNTQRSPAEVGRSFESMFASMIVKQLRQSSDGESIFPNDKGDVIGGMFDQFLGDHIAKAGDLGVARMIRTQLERRGANA